MEVLRSGTPCSKQGLDRSGDEWMFGAAAMDGTATGTQILLEIPVEEGDE